VSPLHVFGVRTLLFANSVLPFEEAMKTKLFFLLLLFLVLASYARISIQRPSTIRHSLNPNTASIEPRGPGARPGTAKLPPLALEPSRSYGQLPLSFEVNQGQTDPQVQFLSPANGYTLFLTKTEAVMQLPIADRKWETAIRQGGFSNPQSEIQNPRLPLAITDFRLPLFDWKLRPAPPADSVNRQSTINNRQWAVVRMKLIGSDPNPEVEGLDRLPGISNYFIGNDPKRWHTNIPNYSRVQYHKVYAGIDLVYYGNQGQLEYDLVVAPGADPHVIKLAYEGVDEMHLDSQDDLVLRIAGTEIRQHKPKVYQLTNGEKREIAGHYLLKENQQVGLEMGDYDPAKSLVIDPVLVYSTFLGGRNLEFARGIAADASGNAYITGSTSSPNFPTTAGAFHPNYDAGICPGYPDGPCDQAFVVKLNSAGNAFLYSTFLGGKSPMPERPGGDRGFGISVDSTGNAYVTGSTASTDFPVVNAVQATGGAYGDAFVTKLNAMGSALEYSTYLGGGDLDDGIGIVVDASANAYVLALTSSTDFPVSKISHRVFGNNPRTYLLKLNPAGTSLAYSAALGGATGTGIALDNASNLYVTGYISSEGFPTVNPFQEMPAGAFISKLNPAGTELLYSSYLGGSGQDYASAVAVDTSGSAYVVGSTRSTDFPTTSNAFQKVYEGFGESTSSNFVTKINNTGTALVYSTYLLSKQVLWLYDAGVAVDTEGNAYVTSSTSSSEFPTVDPLQGVYAGTSLDESIETGGSVENYDVFVVKFDPLGSVLYSTFLGGSRSDLGSKIAVDLSGNAYVTGATRSADFPTYQALRSNYRGDSPPSVGTKPGDAFVAKISDTPAISLSLADAAFGFEGGMTSVNVTAPQGYSWTAVSHASWITVASGSSGSGSGTVSFSVDPTSVNAGPRTGTITIAGRVFTVTQDPNDIFIPAIVSANGVNNSFFTSELTLTNRGSQPATLEFGYTPSWDFGGSGGNASDALEPGRQRIIPDAIAYLKSLGIPIGSSGDQVGTLRIHVREVPASLVSATVRTTTAVADGRAVLAYAGIPTSQALRGTVYLCGLRQNASDRSNVALQNAGTSNEGDVALQLTVFSGDLNNPLERKLPVVRLAPGDFKQISGILVSNGLSLSNGYVRVERVSGAAPYYAYAVINNLANSDGSFVSPQPDDEPYSNDPLSLPVVVETTRFDTEVIVSNWSNVTKTIWFQYFSKEVDAPGNYAQFQMDLKPSQQWIIPNFIGYLRKQGVPGVQRLGPTYAGILYVVPLVPLGHGYLTEPSGVYAGARTSTPGGGGRYGLFYRAVPRPLLATSSRWLYGLQQNSETRSNVALVDATGPEPDRTNTYAIELFDGDTGAKVNTVRGITLESNQWIQINRILADYAPGVKQGYAHVAPTGGSRPFIGYAVINDGSKPGERTGDGAFIDSSP